MDILQTAALVFGMLASLVAVLAYVEPRLRLLPSRKPSRRSGPQAPEFPQRVIRLPESGGAEIPISEFVSAWGDFVKTDNPLTANIPVGSENAVFDKLRRRDGLDALCRTLRNARPDARQVTNKFWEYNGDYFTRSSGPWPDARREIDLVSLSEKARAVGRSEAELS